MESQDTVVSTQFRFPLPPLNNAPWNPPLLRKRGYDPAEDIWRDGPLPMDLLEALLMRSLKHKDER